MYIIQLLLLIDIVMARSNKLEFYNKGSLVYTATPAAHRINCISYDPVFNRILFADQHDMENAASSFDIATKKTQSLIKKTENLHLTRFAYDPATEFLFGTDRNKLYLFSTKPANNNEVNLKKNLVIDFESTVLHEVAVDSCRGHIYWIADNVIGRARMDGSERKLIIDKDGMVKQGLTIDTDKIYWIESQEYNNGAFSIESADLNGNNRRTIYNATESDYSANTLTVSKGFISWGNSIENFVWQLPKNSLNDAEVKPNKILMTITTPTCGVQGIAANYKISRCISALYENLFCVNGKKVSGEFRCDCTQGYTGERCDVSNCHNYCLQGDCSVTADGQPYCRCNAGYSGERCEVYACSNYCAHNGVCSLNDNNEPVCQCTEPYSGKRCTVTPKGYQWLPLNNGQLPRNAIIGGYDYDYHEDIYVARAYNSDGGSLCPGKYVKSNFNSAFIPWGGDEYRRDHFQILCGLNPKWVKVDSNVIPKNAFVGGRSGGPWELEGEPLYVCKGEVKAGIVVCGKVYAGACYLPYNFKEIKKTSYEILVVPDDEIE